MSEEVNYKYCLIPGKAKIYKTPESEIEAVYSRIESIWPDINKKLITFDSLDFAYASLDNIAKNKVRKAKKKLAKAVKAYNKIISITVDKVVERKVPHPMHLRQITSLDAKVGKKVWVTGDSGLIRMTIKEVYHSTRSPNVGSYTANDGCVYSFENSYVLKE